MPYLIGNHTWNSVDIRGADGLLHHGRIIDCTPQGLLIDFGCGVPQLVPFGMIYHYRRPYSILTSDQHRGLQVEVLMRRNCEEPAKWYRGTLIDKMFGGFDTGKFGLVRITAGESTLMEIAPGDRIRIPLDDEQNLLLEACQFVKEEVQLPSGVSIGSPSPGSYQTGIADQHLVKCFNSACLKESMLMLASHIDSGVLHVLKATDQFRSRFAVNSRNSYPFLPLDTVLVMLGVESDGWPDVNRKRPNDESNETSTSKRSRTTESVQVNNRGLAKRAPIHHLLPKELLAEIFACLNGVEQVRLLVVCSQWNDILTARSATRNLRVGMAECQGKCGTLPSVFLLKRWTPQTKIIVNTSMQNFRGQLETKKYREPLACNGRLFRCIMEENQLPRLDTVLLANVVWTWRINPFVRNDPQHFSNFVNHIHQELADLASVCERLVLKDVTVAMTRARCLKDLGPFSGLTEEETSAIVHITSGRIPAQLSVEDLWNMLESNLLPLSSEELMRCVKGLKDSLQYDMELYEQIIEILNERQSADPRTSNQFRDRAWTHFDFAGLELENLNRITLHSLLRTSCRKKPVFVFSW